MTLAELIVWHLNEVAHYRAQIAGQRWVLEHNSGQRPNRARTRIRSLGRKIVVHEDAVALLEATMIRLLAAADGAEGPQDGGDEEEEPGDALGVGYREGCQEPRQEADHDGDGEKDREHELLLGTASLTAG